MNWIFWTILKNHNFWPFWGNILRKYWDIPDSTRSYWKSGQWKFKNYNRKVSKEGKRSQIQTWIKFFGQFWEIIIFCLFWGKILRKYRDLPDSTRSFWKTGQWKFKNYNRKVSKEGKKSQIETSIKFFEQFWKIITFGSFIKPIF